MPGRSCGCRNGCNSIPLNPRKEIRNVHRNPPRHRFLRSPPPFAEISKTLLWQTLPPQQRDRLVANLSRILQQFLNVSEGAGACGTCIFQDNKEAKG